MDIIKAQKEFIEAQQKFIAVLLKNQGITSSETEEAESSDTEFEFKGSIAENVREFRKKAGLTQTALSEMTGIGKSMLCQIEKGTKIPSLGVALNIAKALGCTVDELCGEECT